MKCKCDCHKWEPSTVNTLYNLKSILDDIIKRIEKR